jgi:hypothetical protein
MTDKLLKGWREIAKLAPYSPDTLMRDPLLRKLQRANVIFYIGRGRGRRVCAYASDVRNFFKLSETPPV